eukprot:gene1661-1850_t
MLHDTVSGRTFLDIMNIVAFQENESSSASLRSTLLVAKSKQRSIPCEQTRATDMPNVDPKKEPRRLLLEAFINQCSASIPEEVGHMLRIKNKGKLHAALKEQPVQKFLVALENYQTEMRNGVHGKTAQYWLQYYLDIMQCQHIIHAAIQENDYDLRRYAWEYMLPFYFSLNKTTYA